MTVVDSLLNIQLDGTVELIDDKGAKNKEFNFFSTTMLTSEDRNAGYLKGGNSLKLTGIPSGKTINVGVSRPPRHPVAEECKTKLSITIPTFIDSLPLIKTGAEGYEYGMGKDRIVRKIIQNAKSQVELKSQLENLHSSLNYADYVLSKDLLFSSHPPQEKKRFKKEEEDVDDNDIAILIQPDNIIMPPSLYHLTSSSYHSVHSQNGKYKVYV